MIFARPPETLNSDFLVFFIHFLTPRNSKPPLPSISVHISSSELLLSSSLLSAGPFFLDFQVPSGKDVFSTTLVHEIVDFSQNLDNPFLEVLFLLKPRRNGFLLHFQEQMAFPDPFPSTIFLFGGSPEYYFPLRFWVLGSGFWVLGSGFGVSRGPGFSRNSRPFPE